MSLVSCAELTWNWTKELLLISMGQLRPYQGRGRGGGGGGEGGEGGGKGNRGGKREGEEEERWRREDTVLDHFTSALQE